MNAVRQAATTSRVGALDGLRGFAVLAVLSSHLIVAFDLASVARGGFIGVLVFFVLSGYLITKICWRGDPSWRGYAAFVRRRALRLVPALCGLVVGGLAVCVLVARQPVRIALTDAALAAGQLTAFGVAAGRGIQPVWGPTWSLTVEWTYYLLWPLAVMALRWREQSTGSAVRLTAMCAAVLYGLGLLLSDVSFYVLPVANLGAMLAGATLALRHADNRAGARSLLSTGPASLAIGLLGVLPFLPVHSLGPGYRFLVFPTVALLSVIAIDACRYSSRLSGLLAWRPLQYVGVRAYSTYLWHMPVFWLVSLLLRDLPTWAMACAGLLLVVPVVGASFRFLEEPWLSSQPSRPGSSAPEAGTQRQPATAYRTS